MTTSDEFDGPERYLPPFSEPVVLGYEEAERFVREGFTGDKYISREAGLGFTALQVNVHGEHPRKRILPGNTRTYYVASGDGVFTLNNEDARPVAQGDFVVIPAGGEYSYKTTDRMTLFEMNVSPDNTFGDELVEPVINAESSTAPATADPNEIDTSVVTARMKGHNPQREALAYAVSVVLGNGFAMSKADAESLMKAYGYPENTRAYYVMETSRSFEKLVAKNGVNLAKTSYRGVKFYVDPDVPIDDLDFGNDKNKIDQKIERNKAVLALAKAAKKAAKR